MPRSTERPVVRRAKPGPPCVAYIALGANLGDPRAALDASFEAIATLPRTALRQASSLYRSAPIDSSGPEYLNAVVRIDTRLAPEALLRALQRIERAWGRVRPYRNAPRTLDLDLLLYGDLRIETPVLTVPHPRLQDRRFVLQPLAELSPDLVVPGRGPVGPLLQATRAQRVDRLSA